MSEWQLYQSRDDRGITKKNTEVNHFFQLPIFSLPIFHFSLEELQICSNNYSTVSLDTHFHHQNLKRVYISKNNLTDWKSLCRLGYLFPHLETLIASDNPLQTFRSDDNLECCFPRLRTLSVDQVRISEWIDIIALTKLPCLHALRIHSAPLLKVYQKDERFFLLLGYMKNLTKLNGSDITATERETSERRFIRYYSQRDDKPERYFQLTEKHGNLKPLVDIKIRAAHLAQVRLIYNQINYEKEIDVRQTVQQFKKYLHELFQVPLIRLRVFYVDDMAFNMGVGGPEELKYPQRLLHTYKIHDGDQFHVDLKPEPVKPQTRGRKKSTDNPSLQSSPPVEMSPFSFDSLQKLAQEKDPNNNHTNSTLIAIDHLYPSMETRSPTQTLDDDDDLLLAAATACTKIKTNS